MFQTEPICILRAGDTVDGRFIEQQMIDDIAETYDPKTYNARINPEHWKWGEKFGSVLSVEKRDNELYAVLKPNSKLLSTVEQGQLLHTSCEIQKNFANTGKYYLTGLALTDDPASLGTTEIKLSSKQGSESREHFCSGETLNLNPVNEQAKEHPESEKFFKKLFSLFNQSNQPNPEESETMDKETKELLEKQSEQLSIMATGINTLTTLLSKQESPEDHEGDKTDDDGKDKETGDELSVKVDKLSEQVDTLVEKLSKVTDEQFRDLAGTDNETPYL